jgi:hypothetical protein
MAGEVQNNNKSLRPKERIMAANQITAQGAPGHSDMDYPAHLASYRLFTSLLKWGTIIVVLAVLLLALLTL